MTGGFDLGFQRAGIKTLWAVEIDPYCQKVLKKNFPETEIFGDIKEVHGAVAHSPSIRRDGGRPPREGIHGGKSPRDEIRERSADLACGNCLPRVDILSGGFPCQDISVAGKQEGIDGARSGLWSEFHRIIGELRPKFVVIENVANLVSLGLERILCDLAEIGYDAEWQIISANDVGAPHLRKRIWIVAYPGQQPERAESGGFSGEQQHSQAQGFGATQGDRLADSSQNVADTTRERLQNRRGASLGESGRAKPQPERCDSTQFKIQNDLAGADGEGWWTTEPNVGRVAARLPSTLDEIIRNYGYEDGDIEEAITKIDSHRKRFLQEMWEKQCEIEPTPHRAESRCCDNSLHEMSCLRTYEKWYLGNRIKEIEIVRDLWEEICSQPFKEAQDLLEEMLECIRDYERNEKVASDRVPRLKGLGNAVVPQIPEIIGRRIVEIF